MPHHTCSAPPAVQHCPRAWPGPHMHTPYPCHPVGMCQCQSAVTHPELPPTDALSTPNPGTPPHPLIHPPTHARPPAQLLLTSRPASGATLVCAASRAAARRARRSSAAALSFSTLFHSSSSSWFTSALEFCRPAGARNVGHVTRASWQLGQCAAGEQKRSTHRSSSSWVTSALEFWRPAGRGG